MDLDGRAAIVTGGFPKCMGEPGEIALLVESIARDPHFSGESIRLDRALRVPLP